VVNTHFVVSPLTLPTDGAFGWLTPILLRFCPAIRHCPAAHHRLASGTQPETSISAAANTPSTTEHYNFFSTSFFFSLLFDLAITLAWLPCQRSNTPMLLPASITVRLSE